MSRLILPAPPSAEAYRTNPLGFMRAMEQWGQRMVGAIRDSSRIDSLPAGQAVVATGYTTNTAVTGTTTGTDLANFVCTLVDVLQAASIVSANSGRSNPV